ncbi:uncharacterized protein LOC128883671 [Hylaeus volcanicus]|uniref:uncharacterized protein LOC128883671 n=1 Tax=Hylaeus volcanicus TaxID=313075 RepID=UPI0023B7940F|nr:uncharacterized protein LOC128883671 [Hylaeus volcanicus]
MECPLVQPLQRDTSLKMNLLADNLELFFEFVAKYFFPGHPDMLELFGETLWPEFTSFLKTLVAGLNVPSTTLDRLRDFETKLKGLHVLSFKENTLSLFCRQYDHLIFSERRTRMLSDIRELCTTMDPAVTAVGHDGSHDVLLKNMQATIELLKADTNSNVNLIESLEASPLVLPKCHVSTAAFETVMMIDNLLKGVLESISLKKIDDNLLTCTIDTVRDAVSFFLFLRSTLHHEHLLKDTQYAAVFYCDLLFLSRRMLLLLPTVEKHIPRIIQARQCQVSLLDLVLTIRPIQEEVFNNMLLYHHKKLVKLCEGIPTLTSLSLDEEYMTGEAKIGEIIQELKLLLASWVAVLPNDLAARSFGRLLDTFLSIFLDQITTQTNNSQFSIEDSNALSFLLASSCDQLTAVLTTLQNIDHHTKMWSSFLLFKDLINADMSQFISEKKIIRQKLTIKQIQTVLAINVCKTSTSKAILDSLLSTD